MGNGDSHNEKQLAAELAEARRRIGTLETAAADRDLSQLTDAMLDGFSLLTADGVHLDANPALCTMTGFSRDDLIGVGAPHPYWPPEEYAAIEAAFAKTLAGDTATFALTFMRKDGERFPVLVTPALIRDESGAVISAYATVKDVSEQRRSEAALAESEELFRLTFEQAPIGAALVGLDFRFQRVNARFAQMTGYSVDELLERGFPDITHPDDVPADVQHVRRLAVGEIEEYAREKRYVRKDGSVAWGDVVVRPVRGDDGRPLGFVAMIADITARRRADEERAELFATVQHDRQSMARLIDSMADEVWLVDEQGRFTLANPAALQEFGAAVADETAVLDVAASLEILRPDGTPRPPEEAPPLRALAGEVVRNQEEIVRTPGSGALRHRLVNATPLRDADGMINGCVCVVRDVTELQRAEQSVRENEERLRTVFRATHEGILLQAQDGRLLTWNAAAEALFGMSESEIVGESALGRDWGAVHEDGTPWPPSEHPSMTTLATGDPQHDVVMGVLRDGAVRWISITTEPIWRPGDALPEAVVVTFDDVTERREARLALQRERDRAQSYLDIAGVMLVAIGADQMVLFANRKACEVLERDEADIVGKNWFDTTLPEAEREPIRTGFAQLMADNVAPWEYVENRVVTGTGDERLIAWHNTVMRDDAGAIVATLSSGEDVTERRQVEEALRASEDTFKYVFDHSPVGKSLTLPDGHLNVNDAMCRMLGYTRDELAHSSWQEITHPEDVAETESQMNKLRSHASDSVRYLKRYLKKDGSVVWADVSSSLRRDESGEPVHFMTTVLDITERKRYERLLSVPSEILEIIAAPLPIAETVEGIVAALKRATGFDAVGLRLEADDDYPFVASQGYTDEFLAAENVLALRSTDGGLCRDADGSVSLECTCGLVITGQTDPENPLFTPGGSAWTNDALPFLDVPLEDDPRLNPRNRCIHVGFRSLALVPLRAGDEILGLVHLADRRTDRFTPESIRYFEGLGASIGVALLGKQAEEALRSSEQQYRIVAENTYDWEWWATPEGSYAYVSPGCERITGHTPAEFQADAGLLEAITHPDDLDALSEHLAAGKAGAGEPDELVFRIRTRTGGERVVEHRCKPVYGDDGTYLGRRGTNRDITERRQAEDEIRRLNRDLADRYLSRTEQMEAANRELEALAYSVAHDVRTPLRTIDGFSAMLIEDERERLSPEGVDELRRVRAAAQTLARLLDELTGLSNVARRPLVRQAVDFSGLARDVAAEVAADEPPHAVELTVTPSMSAEADPVLLRLILRELLKNAWKFTRRRQNAHVEVGALDADGERAYFVRDDGAGFDLRRAEHLFGVFQRLHTPEEFEGDGVGLATVQRLVHRHGGRVWVEAKVDEGATFFFTLPEPEPAA